MTPFFLLVSISLALLSNTTQADLIGDICSKSTNPSSCTEALRSDPRSRGADTRDLGKIVVEKAQNGTEDAIEVAKSLTEGGKTKTCIEYFNKAVVNLSDCKKLLEGPVNVDITTLQFRAYAALTHVDACSQEFGPSEPPQLKQVTEKTHVFIQLILVIAKAL